MRISPRTLGSSLFTLLAAGLVVAACSDRDPLLPEDGPRMPPVSLDALLCSADVAGGRLECRTPLPGVGRALILGGQGEYVRMIGTNITVTGTDPRTFAFDGSAENLIRQPWGTTDTATYAPHATGVRVFLVQDPVVTGGTGTVSVANPDGVGIFTASDQPYFQYSQIRRGGAAVALPAMRNDTTVPKSWQFQLSGGVTSFSFLVLVSTEVPYPGGWTDVVLDSAVYKRSREDTVLLPTSGSQQLQGAIRSRVGKLEPTGTIAYASSNPAAATVSQSGLVAGVAPGIAVVSGSATDHPAFRRTRVIVNNPSVLAKDSASALENVTRTVSAPGVLANDTDPEDALTVTARTVATARGGSATTQADGSFTFISAPGVAGRDSFYYRASDGVHTDSALVVMRVEASGLWYVRGGATGGNGTQPAPFGTIAAAQAVAAVGDSVLVQESATGVDEGITLGAGRVVIGAGIPASLTHTLADGAVATKLAAGTAPILTRTAAGATVTLGSGNTIRGVDITSSSGAGISGSSFGTLTVSTLSVNAAGPALHLTTGTVSGSFTGLTSTGSATQGLFLSGVSGPVAATTGSITSVSGNAVEVVGGTVSLTYPGSITKNSGTGALLSVSGGHATGSVTLSGGPSATVGTGLQFDNADGTYAFTGGVTLNGGDAAIDVLNGSSGTFTFPATSQITNPSGEVINIQSSAPTFTYSGGFTKSVAPSYGILIIGNTGGTVTINGDGTAEDGDPADVTKTLTTTNRALEILGNSGMGVVFSGGGLALNSTLEALNANLGGTIQVTGPDNVAVSGDGIAISMSDISTGAAGLSFETVSNTGGGFGLYLKNLTGAGVQVTVGGNLAGGQAVRLEDLSALTSGVSLTGLTLGGTGTGIVGSNFGILTVSGVTVNAGRGLSLSSGTVSGTFTSVTSTVAAGTGVSLSNVGGTWSVGGGTVTSTDAPALSIAGNSPAVELNLTYAGSLAQSGANTQPLVSISNHDAGDAVTITGGMTAATASAGLRFTNADGTYGVSPSGATVVGGDSAGVDILSGSSGTYTFGSNLTLAANNGTAFNVDGSTPNVTYSGGIQKTGTAAGRLVSIVNQASGTITFQTGTLTATSSSASSSGILLNNADGAVNFNGTTTLNGGDAGVDIETGSGGTISFGSGTTLSNPSGIAYREDSGTAAVSFNGTITKTNNANNAVDINAKTGGTTTFSGSITANTSTATAIDLTANTNGTISFTGGLSLTTTNGTALNATGGGTVTATQNNTTVVNTLTSTAGVGLNVQNTNIGASGLTFRSINTSGSGVNGIALVSTGTAGGLTVTGNGGVCTAATPTCTGGRITATSGVNGSTAGRGIYLDNTRNVSLTLMRVDNHPNFAIHGNNVTAFTLTSSLVDGTNGNDAASDESSIFFRNLLGYSRIADVNVSGGLEDNIDVNNTSGTLDSLVITNTTVGANSNTLGEDGLVFVADASAVMRLRVRNSTFTSARSDLVQVVSRGATSNVDVRFSGNTLNNQHTNILSGGGGTVFEADNASSASVLTFNIANNTFRGALGIALNVYKGPGTGSVSGTITGNTVGVSGVANSGSSQAGGIVVDGDGGGSVTVAITNNQVRQYNEDGIHLNIGSATSSAALNATVTGNTVEQPGSFGSNGFELNGGTNSGNNNPICLDLQNNTLENGGNAAAFEDDVNVRQRFATVLRMPGYTGGSGDTGAVQAYLAGRNPGAETVIASASGVAGSGYFNTSPAGSACAQPGT